MTNIFIFLGCIIAIIIFAKLELISTVIAVGCIFVQLILLTYEIYLYRN